MKAKRMFYLQGFYRTDIKILKELGYTVLLSNSLFDFLRYRKYGNSFLYFYKYSLFAAIISKIFGKKVIFTGGIDYLDKDYAGNINYYIQKIFFILSSAIANKIIIVSDADMQNIKRFKKNLPVSKYFLSYHTIEFEKYKNIDIDKKEKILSTIVWMGNKENVLRKGIDKALKLYKNIYKFDNQYRMIIIGPIGEGTKLVKNIIQYEKLDGLIVFTGGISEKEKIEILKKSRIYAQLSIYEGFGIAAIEALASGNIVVHTGKGGLKYGIGNNGILVNIEDKYEDVAKKILNIISDREKYFDIIAKGVDYISKKFTYEKRLKDFIDIFEKM
ncbi:glycosyltransferase family 4 protein [Rectinema subterraneum]|uniref:glycosyltransferase family 4 protein n=1 Tax=Rectinema subterraneum TaxID=2653714 RepID=UPI00131E1D1E|nr:glycosyltransferase family 4 protein [Rectinema subterraneum]